MEDYEVVHIRHNVYSAALSGRPLGRARRFQLFYSIYITVLSQLQTPLAFTLILVLLGP